MTEKTLLYILFGLFGFAIIAAPVLLEYDNNLLALLTSIVTGVTILFITASKLFSDRSIVHYKHYE